MQHLRRRSVQDGLFVLAAGIALLIYSLYEMTHARVKASWIMSPYLFPSVLGGLGTLLGMILLTGALRKAREDAPAPVRMRDMLVILGLSVLYNLALTPLGFIAATLLYLLVACALFGVRRPQVLLPVSILTPLALYLIFKIGLGVRLP